MTNNVPIHSGENITWNGTCGIVDASDLGGKVDDRVWADACDVGFKVRSNRTGKEVLFIQDAVITNSDGEVEATVYKSQDGRITIKVVND